MRVKLGTAGAQLEVPAAHVVTVKPRQLLGLGGETGERGVLEVSGSYCVEKRFKMYFKTSIDYVYNYDQLCIIQYVWDQVMKVLPCPCYRVVCNVH